MIPRTENNNNCLPGRRKPNNRHRLKKRLSTLLHTHVALILLSTLAVLDAGCVIGQIISDILIMKDELHEKQLMESEAKKIIFDLFPGRFNRSGYDEAEFESILLILRDCFQEVNGPEITRIQNKFAAAVEKQLHKDHNHANHHHHLHKRGSGGNHKHTFKDSHKIYTHHILHELTHAFHLGSFVILTILLLETFLKVLAMGKKFLNHKIEVFDAFVVLVSWILDVAFWEGLWAHPETEAARIMTIILPWRLVRIVNSFVMVIQEKDQVQLKIIKQQYRGSVKRASDMKMKVELYRVSIIRMKVELYRMEMRQLQSLCRRRGASEKEIQTCAPEGKRRRSSLLPVLTRLASVGLLGSMTSSNDLTKEAASNDTSDEEDSALDMNSRPNSNFSNFSSDCYSLARTISTGSSVSAIAFPCRGSVENLVKDNPAFTEDAEDVPPNYSEIEREMNEEVGSKL
ncbi:Hypothetical predicted protein [Mytilus galloprovincialis]|uniref:Voltage-gated hydrogen channel 1 n=1 Tax=Mytilus galloprovincialis TaxID=29158 RepID=A0A8B6D963_MYTGA|nr:Hypothetical predicted protein [Mytilus galloprovincialis]